MAGFFTYFAFGGIKPAMASSGLGMKFLGLLTPQAYEINPDRYFPITDPFNKNLISYPTDFFPKHFLDDYFGPIVGTTWLLLFLILDSLRKKG